MNFFNVGKKVDVTLPAIEQGDGVTALQCAFNDWWPKKTGPAEDENFFAEVFSAKIRGDESPPP